MNDLYVEALNAMSIESYEGYFESLNAREMLPTEDLRSIEKLPVRQKATSYALAILSCALCTREAKEYARKLLQQWM